jgi:hypothetical protein
MMFIKMLNMSGSPNMRKFKTTEARTMPAEMSFPNAPGCFAIQANHASTGVHMANTVQPIMKLLP